MPATMPARRDKGAREDAESLLVSVTTQQPPGIPSPARPGAWPDVSSSTQHDRASPKCAKGASYSVGRRASMRCRVECATNGCPSRICASSSRNGSSYFATEKSGTHHTHLRRIHTMAPTS